LVKVRKRILVKVRKRILVKVRKRILVKVRKRILVKVRLRVVKVMGEKFKKIKVFHFLGDYILIWKRNQRL
jgi:hypothetical protein